MNIVQPPAGPRSSDRPPEDLDDLLRAFVRSEMPDPWPAMPVLPQPSLRIALPTSRRWFHPGSRVALAATLALCLVGSLALAGLFPGTSPRDGPSSEMGHIGERLRFSTTSPDGRKVKGWEQIKGNTRTIKIELDDMP